MTQRVAPQKMSRVCSSTFNLLRNVCGNSFFVYLVVFLLNTKFTSATSSAALASSTDLFTNRSGCTYAGRRYKNGAEVGTAEKCLRCLCLSSQLVCRLRVCARLPDPPPPGCILLQRANQCCPQLVCKQDGAVNENSILEGRARNGNPVFSQNGPGCLHNGTVYGEGSAMSTSSDCQYCYCIKGQQHCVTPQCVLTMPGCQPVFTKHSCCPIKYNCSHSISTTTSQPIPQSKGCSVNGSVYEEGDRLDGLARKCETCYCVLGAVRCEPVTCSVPSGAKQHCKPVFSDLHCCPISYKCSQQIYEDMPKETRNYNSKEDKTVGSALEVKPHPAETEHILTTNKNSSTNTAQNLFPTNSKPSKTPLKSSTESNSTTETETTDLTTLESRTETIYVTTTDALTTEDSTTEDLTTSVYDVDYSSTMDSSEVSTTDVDSTTLDPVTTVEPFLPTLIPSSTVKNGDNTTAESLKSNESSTTTTMKAIPPELEAILNSTQNKEPSEDYDYDYNESSLPPSLPNLRIIPFVAADAVVAKTDTGSAPNYANKPLHPTQQRKNTPYYKLNHHSNRFSPPTETEGGFVPKEPPLDLPLYDGPYHSVGFNIEITVPPPADQALPSPTANLEKMCIHNGKRYRSGEVVGEPVSCNTCMCYYGEVVCQEPKCSLPPPGCSRVHDPTVGCCGRIVCGTNDLDSPTRVIEHINTPTPPHAHAPHYSPPTTNLPAFTIADSVVSTPDPFRDVIRTEPAPDLPSLIGEIIHLWDQTTQQYGGSTSSLPSITTGAYAVVNEDGGKNGTGNDSHGLRNGGSGIEDNSKGSNGISNNNIGIRNGGFGTGNDSHGIRNGGCETENTISGIRNGASGIEDNSNGSNGISNNNNGVRNGGSGIQNNTNESIGFANNNNGIRNGGSGTGNSSNGVNGIGSDINGTGNKNDGMQNEGNKGYIYNGGNKNKENVDYNKKDNVGVKVNISNNKENYSDYIHNTDSNYNVHNSNQNPNRENVNIYSSFYNKDNQDINGNTQGFFQNNNKQGGVKNDGDDIYGGNRKHNIYGDVEKEDTFSVKDKNDVEKVDSNKISDKNNAGDGIDRIDVGFATSSEENREEIYLAPIFKSNKTRKEPIHVNVEEENRDDSSPHLGTIELSKIPSKVVVQKVDSKLETENPLDSLFLSSAPSKTVVQSIDSKLDILSEIPKVGVVSKIETHVTSTESVSSQVGTTSKLDKNTETSTLRSGVNVGLPQVSNDKYDKISSTTEDRSSTGNIVTSTSSTNLRPSSLSSTTPRVLETTSKLSNPSSYLFSTDDSDDIDDSEAELKNEEDTDYSDNFSLDSVFKFFFDSGSEASEASTVKLPASETVTTPPTSTSTSRKPVSLKTPIFPVTSTTKPSAINKTSPLKISTTTHSPVKNTYFSSRITAKPVKDIINNSHKNVTTTSNHSKIDVDVEENQPQEVRLSPDDLDKIIESEKLRTEKPIIYINRFHSVTNDLKNRNRTRIPGTITRIPPSGIGANRNNGTGTKHNATGAVTPGSNKFDGLRNGTVNKFGSSGTGGNKFDGSKGNNNGTINKFGSNKYDGVRGHSNGTLNKFNGYAALNRTPGSNRNVTGGIIKPLNRIPGVYSRVPGTVSRISSTTAKSSTVTDDEVQHISAVQPTTADPSAVTGLLKLAGCNIYGRMYRVGKIITELSGPCLECMCTEVGVQCRPLPCS